MICENAKGLLTPYMDAELASGQRADVSRHLEECVSCSSSLQELEQIRQLVRDEIARARVPDGLRDRVVTALRGAAVIEKPRRNYQLRPWLALAAAIAIVGIVSAPFLIQSRQRARLLTAEIVSAHERALAGRDIDVVSSDRHTVKPWFNGKVPFSPPVADLASDGFPLAGGRIDFLSGKPVAALVYHRRLHQIDVFAWPSSASRPPLSSFSRDGYNEISWQQNGFVLTAVSDLANDDLTRFVHLLQSR